MTTDKRPIDPRDLWQADAADGPASSELRTRIERVVGNAKRRNAGALVVSAIVLAGCFWWFAQIDDPLARAGAMLTAIGVGAIVLQVRANQGEQNAARRAAKMGTTRSMDFQREELARQRDFHRGRTLWTRLALFAPGPLIFFAGFARAHPEVAATIRFEAAAFALLVIAAVPANAWLARGYQHQLDELDR